MSQDVSDTILQFRYEDVPKDVNENLKYRAYMRHLTDSHPEVREFVLDACREDFLWWVNMFGWLFEPRPDKDDQGEVGRKIRPFVTWPHQDEMHRILKPAFGYEDVGIIKSRGEGASWEVIYEMLHGWIFGEMESYGIVSANLLMADNPKNSDSLSWKVMWALSKLPDWMVSPDDYTRIQYQHAIVNHRTGGAINFYAATGDVSRGGRKTAFLMDEFAAFPRPEDTQALDATRDVSNCRIFLSTPQGPVGAFYEQMKNPNLIKIELWWHQNPTKNRGLYKVTDGIVTLVDREFWKHRAKVTDDKNLDELVSNIVHDEKNTKFRHQFMTKGEYVKDGQYRAPWYDKQCRRSTNPRSIAQELDGSFGGSMERFFNTTEIEKLLTKCEPPILTCDILYDLEEPNGNVRIVETKIGKFQIWSSWLKGNMIPDREHDYVFGVDIAAGVATVHASNSAISIIDVVTKTMVAQFASPAIDPNDLADLCCCLGQFYRGPGGPAKLVPERNGTSGGTFLNRLRQNGYFNVYEQMSEDRRTRQKTKKWGILTQKSTKAALLSELNRALVTGELICPDAVCLEESKCYMLYANGTVQHVASVDSEDPSGAKDNHGDRIIALACAWKETHERGSTKRKNEKTVNNNVNTVGGRFAERDRAERKRKLTFW